MSKLIPEGGFTPVDPYLRCIKCFDYSPTGGKIGTIMSAVVIRINIGADKPHIDIGEMHRCCRCNHIAWVEPMPSAKEYGITKESLIQVLNNNHRMDSGFTKQDFIDAKDASTRLNNAPEYNANKTYEQALPTYAPPVEEKIEEDNSVPF